MTKPVAESVVSVKSSLCGHFIMHDRFPSSGKFFSIVFANEQIRNKKKSWQQMCFTTFQLNNSTVKNHRQHHDEWQTPSEYWNDSRNCWIAISRRVNWMAHWKKIETENWKCIGEMLFELRIDMEMMQKKEKFLWNLKKFYADFCCISILNFKTILLFAEKKVFRHQSLDFNQKFQGLPAI